MTAAQPGWTELPTAAEIRPVLASEPGERHLREPTAIRRGGPVRAVEIEIGDAIDHPPRRGDGAAKTDG